jgi:hypothetical protein
VEYRILLQSTDRRADLEGRKRRRRRPCWLKERKKEREVTVDCAHFSGQRQPRAGRRRRRRWRASFSQWTSTAPHQGDLIRAYTPARATAAHLRDFGRERGLWRRRRRRLAPPACDEGATSTTKVRAPPPPPPSPLLLSAISFFSFFFSSLR